MALKVIYEWLGRVPYAQAECLQKRLLDDVISRRRSCGYLLSLEHPPVITLGRSFLPEHLRLEPELLRSRGVEIVNCRRGGSVTYHGPGQLILYPILPLEHLRRDVHWYLRMLEEAGIRTLATFGLQGERKSGLTGVWVGENKIMAIGIAIRRWVTFHGAALNVTGAALDGFHGIVPCGIRGKGVTSIEALGGCFNIRSVGQRASESAEGKEAEEGNSTERVCDGGRRSHPVLVAARSQDGILKQPLTATAAPMPQVAGMFARHLAEVAGFEILEHEPASEARGSPLGGSPPS